MALYHEQEPELVTLSPPCTAFSQLQALNRHVHGEQYCEKHDEELLRAVEHVKFCIVFAKMQIKRDKWFVFEHPQGDYMARAVHAEAIEYARRRLAACRPMPIRPCHLGPRRRAEASQETNTSCLE